MDMLRQGIKILVLLLVVVISWQCQRVRYNEKKMHAIRMSSMGKSQETIGKKEYWHIYNNIKDSILQWENKMIGLYKYYDSNDLIVDTVICINNARNKLRTCTIRKCIDNCLQDEIVYLNGVKINNKWYFFDGASLALIRKYYQRDIHKPLSWKMMEQIAASQLYSSYLKPDGTINDLFFEGIANKNTASGYGSCFECETEEEYYLYLVKKNWQQK